jgi:Pretoxin HINT domain
LGAQQPVFIKPQCFVAGTEIITRDGTKNIEDIQVGDWVLSDDPNTVGEIEYKQVLRTFAKTATTTIDLYIDGEKITTTEDHPFWVPEVGWVKAKDLTVGTRLQTKTESWLDIDGIDRHSGLTNVYNFEVEGFHTYFVSDLGFLVHNTCGLVRRDDYMYSHEGPVNPKGQQTYKSYIDEDTGNLHPANSAGTATIATHVRGGKKVGPGTKSDSPYTSFSEDTHNSTFFGTNEIHLDLAQLKADIAAKKIRDIVIVDHKTMLKIFERRLDIAERTLSDRMALGNQKINGLATVGTLRDEVRLAKKDLDNVKDAKEVLVKGVIPARYLKTPSQ